LIENFDSLFRGRILNEIDELPRAVNLPLIGAGAILVTIHRNGDGLARYDLRAPSGGRSPCQIMADAIAAEPCQYYDLDE
jgi:hypothetical protein